MLKASIYSSELPTTDRKSEDISLSGTINNPGDSVVGKLDIANDRYPFCIVWTPLPLISLFFPFIGHMGIACS